MAWPAAGLTCYRPGQRSRLIYRAMVHKGRRGEKKGFREADFAALLDSAHQQLGGPIAHVWNNLGGHTSAAMRTLIAARRSWLRAYTLPAYAPELNPVEKVWYNLKRSLANLAAGTFTNLAKLAKTRLKKMQYTDGLVDGFFKPPAHHPTSRPRARRSIWWRRQLDRPRPE